MTKATLLRKEIFVLLYYAIFLTAILAADRIFEIGRHGPGFSVILILLFIPATIGYFTFQAARLERNRNCIFIHLAVWVALFIWISYKTYD